MHPSFILFDHLKHGPRRAVFTSAYSPGLPDTSRVSPVSPPRGLQDPDSHVRVMNSVFGHNRLSESHLFSLIRMSHPKLQYVWAGNCLCSAHAPQPKIRRGPPNLYKHTELQDVPHLAPRTFALETHPSLALHGSVLAAIVQEADILD